MTNYRHPDVSKSKGFICPTNWFFRPNFSPVGCAGARSYQQVGWLPPVRSGVVHCQVEVCRGSKLRGSSVVKEPGGLICCVHLIGVGAIQAGVTAERVRRQH